jgi:hypothetical protein
MHYVLWLLLLCEMLIIRCWILFFQLCIWSPFQSSCIKPSSWYYLISKIAYWWEVTDVITITKRCITEWKSEKKYMKTSECSSHKVNMIREGTKLHNILMSTQMEHLWPKLDINDIYACILWYQQYMFTLLQIYACISIRFFFVADVWEIGGKHNRDIRTELYIYFLAWGPS